MKKLIPLLALIAIILISGCILGQFLLPSYLDQLDYHGQKFHFRANLIEADKLPVYPNETIIKDILLEPRVRKIFLYYEDITKYNPFYSVSSYEFAYKMTIINMANKARAIPIETQFLHEGDIIPSSVYEPVVVFSSPEVTKKLNKTTSIEVNESVIFLYALNYSSIGNLESPSERKYTDLDLAVDKVLLILMDQHFR